MDGLGYLIDDVYLLHNPGPLHPESPQRLRAIQQALRHLDSLAQWTRVDPRLVRPDELELVHHSGLIAHVERAAQKAPSYLDPDTVVSSESYRTALLAAGGVIECVDRICKGELRRAFAFVRPPGHHAEPDRAMGFCLFNNVALAAAYARVAHGMDRVAVVDFDLHHGNGTQACFYDNPHVLYVSSHQFPFYPGTGDFHEIGSGDGAGYTVNFPLPAGSGNAAVVPLYKRLVEPLLEQYRPQIILVSAGFDAHAADPLGGLALTDEGYGRLAECLLRAAEKSCGGKICFVLEGGYDLEALQNSTTEVMKAMERNALLAETNLEGDRIFEQLEGRSRRVLGAFWKFD
jgi:acetoin utilization deacetylase AcuC-like enzyme